MTKNKDTAIEMFVGGLMLDPNTQAPVIVLKDESGETCLPIWIGVAEATSIASAIKQVEMPRPLTHDLMYSTLLEMGARIKSVMITELKDATYFAELVISQGDKIIIMDSRPSDAIAIALRGAAPIYVTAQVIEQAKIVFPNNQLVSGKKEPVEGEPISGEPGTSAESEEETGESSADFKNVDKDKWNELLEDLDPDDFKYKM